MALTENELKKLYEYKYWREVQRNQLTITSNIIFTFSVALIGFTINYLLKNGSLCPIIKGKLFNSISLYSLSILFYLIMNFSKLVDYRKTASLIMKETPNNEIQKKTNLLGKITWYSFILEILLTFIGFIITMISFKSIIFN